MIFQPSDYAWPALPSGLVDCIRCAERYHPDDHRQCPECYAPCARCGDFELREDLHQSTWGRYCWACIEEWKGEAE